MAWADAVLATDADLTKWESRMPDAAKKITAPNGKTAYDGKREIAKSRIESILRSRGMDPDGVQDPTQLSDIASVLELSFIFADMAWRDDTNAADKSAYYRSLFDEEMGHLYLDYIEPTVPTDTSRTRAFKCVPVSRG
jgi:hypothetical protein